MTNRNVWKIRATAIAALASATAWLAMALSSTAQEPPAAGAQPFILDLGEILRDRELVEQFDADKNGQLDLTERRAAREWMAVQPPVGIAAVAARFGGPGGPGDPGARGRIGRGRPGGPPPGAFGGAAFAPTSPGRSIRPGEVPTYGEDVDLYDAGVLRTLFLEFEADDWEQELADFYRTDVEVPATVRVDGVTYEDVGVHFRGMSSFMAVPAGGKRSLNLSFDEFDDDQRLLGYRTLNLLNGMNDATFVRAMLYGEIARSYIPAPKTNFVRVVINGESWGVYVSAQQFNSDFTRDWFETREGARWSVPGSPIGQGGMRYLGEDANAYRSVYEIRTDDEEDDWDALIGLFRVLNQTPPDDLSGAIEPILDVDGALRFLAIEVALVNSDGYWTRASDYDLYRDRDGRFHVIPHDMNEGFRAEGGGGGRGGRGGPGGRGGFQLPPGVQLPAGFVLPTTMGLADAELDPLVGLDDEALPLRSKLLAVPEYRERYLGYVRDIARRWLDWATLEPLVTRYHDLIGEDVLADTRKLYTNDAFRTDVGEGEESLRSFVERRRAFLLAWQPPPRQ